MPSFNPYQASPADDLRQQVEQMSDEISATLVRSADAHRTAMQAMMEEANIEERMIRELNRHTQAQTRASNDFIYSYDTNYIHDGYGRGHERKEELEQLCEGVGTAWLNDKK